jgi:two-component system chemotaxis response regulator CheB
MQFRVDPIRLGYMVRRDIVVVGASAGGVEALSQFVSALPADFPAPVFVTVHFPPYATSVLPRILNRAGPLEALHPKDRDTIEPGKIYIAPPDHHLLVFQGRVRVSRGPTENANRPAIDPMFRTAALAYGDRVIGVLLTGNLDDGTAGFFAIKRRNGTTVVQDPTDAMFPSMPASAIEFGVVDHVAALDEIPALLVRLTSRSVGTPTEVHVHDDAAAENKFSQFDLESIENEDSHPGTPSSFSCPDCGGVLWEIQDGDLVRYRCRIGHGWTGDGLAFQQTQVIEDALGTALRAFEESANLARQLAERAHQRGSGFLARRFEAQRRTAEERGALIRSILVNGRRAQVDADDDQLAEELARRASSSGTD